MKKLTTTYRLSSKRLCYQILTRFIPREMWSIDLAVLRNSDRYATEVSCTNHRLCW